MLYILSTLNRKHAKYDFFKKISVNNTGAKIHMHIFKFIPTRTTSVYLKLIRNTLKLNNNKLFLIWKN